MNIDLLIKMANQITSFWEGELGEEAAAKEVATHLRRYWEPRMRAQMLTYYAERQGSGLNEVAKSAVEILAAEAQAKAAQAATGGVAAGSDPASAPGSQASLVHKVAPANDFSRTPDAADPRGGDAG
jgi:formate dehydrogenase subunit delta